MGGHAGLHYWWFEFGASWTPSRIVKPSHGSSVGWCSGSGITSRTAVSFLKLPTSLWTGSGQFLVSVFPAASGRTCPYQNDIMSQRQFSDAVCYGGWYLDYHPPGGIYSKEEPCEQIPVGLYHIPLRCLYSRNVHNLFMAGRDISDVRCLCFDTGDEHLCPNGQAVGTATAVCLEKSKAP